MTKPFGFSKPKGFIPSRLNNLYTPLKPNTRLRHLISKKTGTHHPTTTFQVLRVQTKKTRMRMPRISLSRDLKLSLLAGVATGLVGVIIFVTVHAVLIVPIWGSLLSGLPVAVIGGPAAAWAFEEMRAAGRLSTRLRIRAGLARATSRPSTAIS